MFLTGLKFALGLMCGLSAFGGIALGLMALVDWLWRKTQSGRHAVAAPVDPVEPAILRREKLLVLPVSPARGGEPAELAQRKPECLQ